MEYASATQHKSPHLAHAAAIIVPQNGTPRSHVTNCPDSGLTRLHGPIGVKRSGCVKGVKDGQDGQALLAQVRGGSYPAGSLP